MHQLLDDPMLFGRQRLNRGASVLRVQLTQIHDDVLDACLLNTMGSRRNELSRHQYAAALELGDTDVRLPWVLGEPGYPAADDALLQRILGGARYSALHRRQLRRTVRLHNAVVRPPSQNVLLRGAVLVGVPIQFLRMLTMPTGRRRFGAQRRSR